MRYVGAIKKRKNHILSWVQILKLYLWNKALSDKLARNIDTFIKGELKLLDEEMEFVMRYPFCRTSRSPELQDRKSNRKFYLKKKQQERGSRSSSASRTRTRLQMTKQT
jgi:hypothetical protein